MTLCLVVSALAYALTPVPTLTTRVTDQVGMLDATQRSALEHKLADLEARKGAQLAVLIVATTQPETIEQYAIRVAEQWKLGRKGVDDGALLLVARDDRALRIEVGYGLEGAIPDVLAKRVIAETIVPRFRAGQSYAGLDAGVDQLIGLVNGEPLPPPTARGASGQHGGDRLSLLLPLLLLALFCAAGLRALLGPGIGALAAGGGMFVLCFVLSGVLLLSLFLAFVAAVLTLFGVHPGMLGGWNSGGGGGFGGGGFGGGGGGFGGGGGGFGGGGASGNW